MTSLERLPERDLVVVGAGIVGLAHAYDAVLRGLRVTVVERDDFAAGASVRNFGHGCFTAQSGAALGYTVEARARWVQLAKDAGFAISEAGTLVLARAEDELAVLHEFHDLRGDDVTLLDANAIAQRAPFADGVIGGALLPLDVRVDARAAVAAIASWLAGHGVEFRWATNVGLVEPGAVTTSTGVLRARKVVVAIGHDVDRLFPDLASRHGVQRCVLHMLRVSNPHGRPVEPAVLTGYSLLRYDGFARCPSAAALASRLDAEYPDARAAGLNLMFTQRPDGTLTIGDTHDYARTHTAFAGADRDELVLAETARLLGVERLKVLERWRGCYASAPDPFLIAEPCPDVRVVSVTSGIGMTTALGLAPTVLDDLL